MDKAGELNRLRWRSRRGLVELDLLLLPFYDEMYSELEADQQQTFVDMLEEDGLYDENGFRFLDGRAEEIYPIPRTK